jgi:hypothetical protein
MAAKIGQTKVLMKPFRQLLEWISNPAFKEDPNCNILRQQLDDPWENNEYPRKKSVIKRTIFFIYEACLSQYTQGVQERLDSVEQTLPEILEVIRGAAMLNPIIELLPMRLDCEARYPSPNDIKSVK